VEITIIYSGDTAWFFVDGKEKLKANLLKSSFFRQHTKDVAFAVISGSNDDFGTRCDFKNTDFWTIEE
jgi:hypothetical protein